MRTCVCVCVCVQADEQAHLSASLNLLAAATEEAGRQLITRAQQLRQSAQRAVLVRESLHTQVRTSHLPCTCMAMRTAAPMWETACHQTSNACKQVRSSLCTCMHTPAFAIRKAAPICVTRQAATSWMRRSPPYKLVSGSIRACGVGIRAQKRRKENMMCVCLCACVFVCVYVCHRLTTRVRLWQYVGTSTYSVAISCTHSRQHRTGCTPQGTSDTHTHTRIPLLSSPRSPFSHVLHPLFLFLGALS